MPALPPPVPPDQRSDKAPDVGTPNIKEGGEAKKTTTSEHANRYADIKQNTTNKGYQQDR